MIAGFRKFRLLAVLAALFALAGCASMGPRTVNISETEIQNKIAENLKAPMTVLKIFDVTLSNPLVKLDESTGRLTTELETNINNPLAKNALLGKIRFSGKPRFDAITSTIYLSEAKLENLDFGNSLDSKFDEFLNFMVGKFGGEMLNEIPLYTLKPGDLKVGNTTYLPSDFKVQGNGLQVTLMPK